MGWEGCTPTRASCFTGPCDPEISGEVLVKKQVPHSMTMALKINIYEGALVWWWLYGCNFGWHTDWGPEGTIKFSVLFERIAFLASLCAETVLLKVLWQRQQVGYTWACVLLLQQWPSMEARSTPVLLSLYLLKPHCWFLFPGTFRKQWLAQSFPLGYPVDHLGNFHRFLCPGCTQTKSLGSEGSSDLYCLQRDSHPQ